jgi:hypothetical protein
MNVSVGGRFQALALEEDYESSTEAKDKDEAHLADPAHIQDSGEISAIAIRGTIPTSSVQQKATDFSNNRGVKEQVFHPKGCNDRRQFGRNVPRCILQQGLELHETRARNNRCAKVFPYRMWSANECFCS